MHANHPGTTPRKRGRTIYQHICTECENPFASRDAKAQTCGMACAIAWTLKKQAQKAALTQQGVHYAKI